MWPKWDRYGGFTTQLEKLALITILLFCAFPDVDGDEDEDSPREPEDFSVIFPKEHVLNYFEHIALLGVVINHYAGIQRHNDSYITTETNTLLQGLKTFLQPLVANTTYEEKAISKTISMSLDALLDSGRASRECIRDTKYLLLNIFHGEEWALKFLDAAGKPGPSLSQFHWHFVGDYFLCRSQVSEGGNSFKGNYVTWKYSLPSIPVGKSVVSQEIRWGVCVPDTCSDKDVTHFANETTWALGLGQTLLVVQAETHNEERVASTATYIAIAVLAIIFILMILGTAYDISFIQWPQRKPTEDTEEEKRTGNKSVSHEMSTISKQEEGTASPPHDGVDNDRQHTAQTFKLGEPLVKVLVAFSVYTNGRKLLDTTQHPGQITCIHGIRFITLAWVVLCHTCSMPYLFFDNLQAALPTYFSRWSFAIIGNAYVSVDTFLVISGFLTAYLTLARMKKQGWCINWGLFYFHRYWRLTPPYMMVILLVVGLQQYCGHGALWASVQPTEKPNCEKYWWTNLIYINNRIDGSKQCLGHFWYVALDMQLFMVSPLMMIPLHFNTLLGLGTCAVFFLTHAITTGVLTSVNGWSGAVSVAGNRPDVSEYFKDYYEAPWCRIGPYIVGIVGGYLMTTHRDKIQLNYRISAVGWVLCTVISLAVLFGLHSDITYNSTTPSPVEVGALYNALARSAWAVCICWVIVACTSGWGGYVNKILSWPPFVVLGRLTFMTYLIHPSIIYIYFGNMQTLFHVTDLNIIVTFFGLHVASLAIAFVFMLAFECPMVALEKVILPQRRND